MIVRDEDFEFHPHPLVNDPEIPEEMKHQLGIFDSSSRAECIELVDDCWFCGAKLGTPFVFWSGGETCGISLHPFCAAQLALGLAQDAYKVSKGKDPYSPRDAARWLDLFASKKEYRIEDEEFPGDPAAKPYAGP